MVRYFYAPICPESFATLERLRRLLQGREEIRLELFNVAAGPPASPEPWYPAEEALLQTCRGAGDEPLLYGKLFVAGEAIPGFPPAGKKLGEVFAKHGIPFSAEEYTHEYGSPLRRERWEDCSPEGFSMHGYTAADLLPACRICTLHHPYLQPAEYRAEKWESCEQGKINYIQSRLTKGDLIGVIAYYGGEPAGFAEALPLPEASGLGFPVSQRNPLGLMITCLSIRKEVSGYGLARRLLGQLEAEASAGGYRTLEVLAFADRHHWQPKSLYEKMGYHLVKPLETEYFLMEKVL